jgi:hypothetical protein
LDKGISTAKILVSVGMPSQPLNAFAFLPISGFHPPPPSPGHAHTCKTLHTFSEKFCDLAFHPALIRANQRQAVAFSDHTIARSPGPPDRAAFAGLCRITLDHPIFFGFIERFLIRVNQCYLR